MRQHAEIVAAADELLDLQGHDESPLVFSGRG
jgi:hypothetical protein